MLLGASLFKALLEQPTTFRSNFVAGNAFIFGLAYTLMPDDEKALA
jgi:hypothetical protein